jgi:hypothetical protein
MPTCAYSPDTTSAALLGRVAWRRGEPALADACDLSGGGRVKEEERERGLIFLLELGTGDPVALLG